MNIDMKKTDNLGRQLAIAFLIIGASWLVTNMASGLVLKLVIEDNFFPSLGKLLTNRDTNPLQHYVDRLRAPIAAAHIIIAILVTIKITLVRQSTLIVFGLLFAGDMILLMFSRLSDIPLLNLATDWALPEIFQYVKEAWAAVMMLIIYRYTKSGVYLSIAILSVFMFIDDAFKYHEQIGHLLAGMIATTSLPVKLQIAPNYIGEVLSLTPLILIAPFGLYSFIRAERSVQVFSFVWGALLVLLVLFGVVFDFLTHSDTASSESAQQIMASLEDIGEMVVMSMIVTFVLSHYWHLRKSWAASSLQAG